MSVQYYQQILKSINIDREKAEGSPRMFQRTY